MLDFHSTVMAVGRGSGDNTLSVQNCYEKSEKRWREGGFAEATDARNLTQVYHNGTRFDWPADKGKLKEIMANHPQLSMMNCWSHAIARLVKNAESAKFNLPNKPLSSPTLARFKQVRAALPLLCRHHYTTTPLTAHH
jgi:hypothetical protein